jgi:uncharacterized protein (TIGR03435 family)
MAEIEGHDSTGSGVYSQKEVSLRLIGIIACLAAMASAQTPGQIAFEAATIKPSAPPSMGPIHIGPRGGPGTSDPGRYSCERCDLTFLITTAYGINAVEVSGPSWMEEVRFDVVATLPAGATKEQFKLMMQNLLAERFKLATHQEKKDLPIYELTVVKGGPKLKASTGPPDPAAGRGPGGARASAAPPPPPQEKGSGCSGAPQPPPGRFPMMMISPTFAMWRLIDKSTAEFAEALQGAVSRPVRDATGLAGKFDFELVFSGSGARALVPAGMQRPPMPVGTADGAAAEDCGPTIFAALQDQLGLKLESRKGPVDTLVVDHVEKTPAEN